MIKRLWNFCAQLGVGIKIPEFLISSLFLLVQSKPWCNESIESIIPLNSISVLIKIKLRQASKIPAQKYAFSMLSFVSHYDF